MKDKVLVLAILIWLLREILSVNTQGQNRSSGQTTRREVAVTFDDLPVTSIMHPDIAVCREITARLLKSISANDVPAIGFVNEAKLLRQGELEEARVSLLRMWLDAGLELGNHTFSHLDLHSTPLELFEQDVIRGEIVTSGLLREKSLRLRYFRHPYLHTGRDLDTKMKFEQFLARRGYRVAPVTISNSDWIFAASYDNALEHEDSSLRGRIAEAYIPYSERMVEYFERQSIELFGYEVKQVLLLHANALNSDHFDDLVKMMKGRGYTFITLEQALKDRAYESPDTYIGPGGIPWLHRWAITKGTKSTPLPPELTPPDFVRKQAARRAQRTRNQVVKIIAQAGLSHTLIGGVLSLPLLYFGRSRARWEPWELVAFVVPFSIWAILMIVNNTGKSLANFVGEPLIISFAILLAVTIRIILGHRDCQWIYSCILVFLLCTVAVATYVITPYGNPETPYRTIFRVWL